MFLVGTRFGRVSRDSQRTSSDNKSAKAFGDGGYPLPKFLPKILDPPYRCMKAVATNIKIVSLVDESFERPPTICPCSMAQTLTFALQSS